MDSERIDEIGLPQDQKGIDRLRYSINRRFPLRVVRRFAKEQVEEEIPITERYVRSLPKDLLRKELREAMGRNELETARLVQLLGLRRHVAREIMTEALINYQDSLGRSFGQDITEIKMDEDSFRGSDLLGIVRYYMELDKHRESLNRNTPVSRLLDKLL